MKAEGPSLRQFVEWLQQDALDMIVVCKGRTYQHVRDIPEADFDPDETFGAIERAADPSPASPGAREQCICAAIKLPNGEIWRGHRHHDCLRSAGSAPGNTREMLNEAIDGFMTSRNRFVTREEGAEIHNAAGIVSADTGQPIVGRLFSEDLYMRERDEAQPSPAIAPAEPPPSGDAETP